MLPNPFTPSRIANKPEDFFGRRTEVEEIPRVVRQGSIVIDGPMGIGKSSLLSQIILALEDPGTSGRPLATVYPLVCDAGLKTPEDIATRLLAELTDTREVSKKTKYSLKGFVEFEKTTVDKPSDGARSLRAVCRLLTTAAKEQERLVVVALDEAEKCAPAVAQFMRVILTTTELDQSGLDRIRFVVAGVSPFYSTMIQQDAGIARFVYQRYSLPPFDLDDAMSFLREKFETVLKSEEATQVNLHCDDDLYELVARVTGGHPHLLQLVGSYILDHEDANPDTVLDARDLVGCFQRVCFQTRGPVYEQMLQSIALDGHLSALQDLLSVAAGRCPTHISLEKASEAIENESAKYFVSKGLFSFDSAARIYRLNDEFLRIRMLLDDPETNPRELEKRLLKEEQYFDMPEIEEETGDEVEELD